MYKATLFDRVKAAMVRDDPFYATMLLNMEVVQTNKLPGGRDLWMAATDGTTLWVNPDNFNKLPLDQAKGVLKHEVMHVAQLHPFRGLGKEPRRWNHAADYTINPVILEEGGALPPEALDGTPWKGQTAEQIYGALPPSPPGGPGGMMDDDVVPATGNAAAAQQKVKSNIAKAAAVAKAMGKLPQSLREAIDEVLNPKVCWKEQLRMFLTETLASDYTWAKPNRRFICGDAPLYLPSMGGHDAMRSLLVVLDTSGSIRMDELKQGLGEIVGAVEECAPRRLIVAYCDAKVQHSDVFDEPSSAQVAETFARHGAGGTNMPAALRWANRNHGDVQAAIVWTDGETDFGDEDEFPYPVVWAITQKHITAPWGTTIHVDLNL